jgi:uncharacterized protein YkwD
MANNAALGILVVIMLAAVTIGAVVGLELGGGLGSGGGAETSSTTAPAVTTTATPTAVPTSVPAATATPHPEAQILPQEFDADRIESEILTRINNYRTDRGYRPVERSQRLDELAIFHSENMAAQGLALHSAGGVGTRERYEQFDLDDCWITGDSKTGLLHGADLEAIARVTAGRPYESMGITNINRNDREVGAAVFRTWTTDESERTKLGMRSVREAGIGVIITNDGEVYVTLNLC